MIWQCGLGKAGCFRIRKDTSKSFKKLVSVCIIFKSFLPFDSSDYNVIKYLGGINFRFTWHVVKGSLENVGNSKV